MPSKELSGVLFKNDRAEKSTDPKYKGQCLVAGVEYWMSAWINDGKDGSKYMNIQFKPKEMPKPAPAAKPAGHFDDMADDIPF